VQKRRNAVPKVQRSGPGRILTDADARLMMQKIKNEKNCKPKDASAAMGKPVSQWTACRALRRIGYASEVKKKKPALSDKNIKARLKFERAHKNWKRGDWERVIWSDEYKFNPYQSDGKQYCCKKGGGNVMVWSCFTWWSVGPIKKIDGIMKKDYLDILQTHLRELVDKCAYKESDITFQQDGDPKHTSKIVKEWIAKQHFKLMEWLAQSPDLNPIENLWSIVKRRLGLYESVPSNQHELWQRVHQEWRAIPKEIIQNLVESIPDRINSVIKNKGLWTKY